MAALIDNTREWGNEHDRSSRDQLLTRMAAYLDVPRLPDHPTQDLPRTDCLLVPGDTLIAAGLAWSAHGRAILGGIVPARFIGTKAITHPLIDENADRPPGWSTRMAELMGDAALRGFTAFTRADAGRAGRQLLADGPIRLKDVWGKAGLGQLVVQDEAELDAALDLEDWPALAGAGIVIEANLSDVVTYSIGSVRLGDESISYWGSQNLTHDHQGREVYGGSDLFVIRGDFPELTALDLCPSLSRAVRCATTFDRAAHLAYPDVRLTRRNYDVIEGLDHAGVRQIGVLEQSWRVGGASGAEIAAFEALRAEPDTPAVRCSTVEIYDIVTPPPGAVNYYQGIDPRVGAMTKYTVRLA
ncbi:DUF3182 family protein [Sphingomonas melonis]|uniref:Biotin carboxylase n=1 Tax=Sphingomonas melonis TaxID=152682 RepID=A0A7Y9FL46_9SPHN|nr:hypothetical protein [Sphingomonas melonis]